MSTEERPKKHCENCTCDADLLAGEERWNEAIDWLLNSRYTGAPEIQGRFWALVDGKTTRDQVDSYDYRKEEGAG